MSTSALMMPAMALLVVIGPTLGALLFREPTVGNPIQRKPVYIFDGEQVVVFRVVENLPVYADML